MCVLFHAVAARNGASLPVSEEVVNKPIPVQQQVEIRER